MSAGCGVCYKPWGSHYGGGLQNNKVTLKGVVLDENGTPLVGAIVKVLIQTGKGFITDLNANFTLNSLSATDKIEITMIGYQAHRLTVGTQKSVQVQLMPDTHKLDEVVVVGYATQRKESLAGSLQSISPKDLKTISPPQYHHSKPYFQLKVRRIFRLKQVGYAKNSYFWYTPFCGLPANRV